MALKNKVVLSYGLLCFMLFNLSTAWASRPADSLSSDGTEGRSEIKPLKIGDTTKLEHYALPYTDSVVVETTRKIPGADLDRFPMEKYHIEESILYKLCIGDPLPADLLKLPLPVIHRNGRLDTLHLEEFGEKLIVLDFWAGWCAPCVGSMEKWEAFKDSLKGDYFFLGVHTDYSYKVLPFLEKREWNSVSVIGLNAFVLARSFFDRIVAGKLVWIKNRRVLALTGVSGYDRQMVQDLIDDKEVQLPVDSSWTY